MWIRFSACAAESAASTSDCTPDFERWGDHLERSATWRGKHSPSRVWVQRFKKGGWTKRLSGAVISETFPQDPWLESIGFVVDTPVNHSVHPASGQGPTTRDTCGCGCSSASRLFDPEESSSKTSQATSRWGCGTSCPIWKAAVSERRGAATRRRLSALHTDGNESSSSGWPTPMTRDHKDGTATYDVPTNGHLGRAAPRDPTSHPGQLNPDWVEMLMGFSVGWTDCAPSETQ